MTDRGSEKTMSGGLWRWSGPTCVASSIGFLAGALASLDLFWSPLAALLPFGFIGWVVTIVVTLLKRRWWWAVASLPATMIPLYIFGEIAAACARGDCL